MASRRVRRRRRNQAIAVVGVAAVVGAGVAAWRHWSPQQAGGWDLAMVVTATSNEFQPGLPADAAARIRAASDTDGAHLKIVLVDGNNVEENSDYDLTPHRDGGEIEHVKANRDKFFTTRYGEISQRLSSLAAKSGGLDLLAGLQAVGRDGHIHEVIAVSSGLSTIDPVNWQHILWDVDVVSAVNGLADRDELPDLRGKIVYFAGLGDVTGRQPLLGQPARHVLENFWLSLCKRSGGDCRLLTEMNSRPKGHATTESPVVPVPTVCTMEGAGRTTSVELSDELLGFDGNSAVLPRTADRVLKPLAGRIPVDAAVRLVGHTADYGLMSGQITKSQERATAVRDRLFALGMPRTVRVAVEGVGPNQPVAGKSRTAVENRRVTMVVTGTSLGLPKCVRSS